jgi:hypothetical protein
MTRMWIDRLGMTKLGVERVLAPALVAGGVELQVPPFRCAPVGMTNRGAAFLVKIC